jgi:medium-chain acyl-[acyl-carrier-protein] hydrolase
MSLAQLPLVQIHRSLTDRALVQCPAGSGPEVRLLCFPHAGGSAQLFRDCCPLLGPGVELLQIELPGRGLLVHQRPIGSMEVLVEALALALDPLLDRPLALFGHGVGALVAFELSRQLQASGRPARHLFVSAQRAPQLPPAATPPIHLLPAAQFLAAVRATRGAAGYRCDDELGELLLPALRGDVKLGEDYRYRRAPWLDLPITVFGGIADPSVTRAELEAWRLLTRRPCVVRWLHGNHYFVFEHQRLLAANVLRSLGIVAPLADRDQAEGRPQRAA